MPSPSPLLHAPSRAQHLFVAAMGLWFMGSLIFRGTMWWKGHGAAFLSGLGVCVFLGIQLVIQKRIVRRITRWPVPAGLNFAGAAMFATGLHVFTQIGVLLLPESRTRVASWGEDLVSEAVGEVVDWLPQEILLLSTWYVAWWAALRIGRPRVSMALIAAGFQHILMKWMIFVHLSGLSRFWMAPLQFFTGWSLMFLPGAVASHELRPQEQGVAFVKQLIVWAGPPIVGFVALFLFLKSLGK